MILRRSIEVEFDWLRAASLVVLCVIACSSKRDAVEDGSARGGVAVVNTGGGAMVDTGGAIGSGGASASGGAVSGGSAGSASGGVSGGGKPIASAGDSGGSAQGGLAMSGGDAAGGANTSTSGGRADSGGANGTGASAAVGAAGASSANGGAGGGSAQPSGSVRIYWVDTEGGASTIIAAPDGRVIVVDAGFQSRDAQRVAAILSELHVSRIDAMIVTHYHIDHIGGIPDLASMFPVVEYFDHGMAIESGTHINAYTSLFSSGSSNVKHTIVKPGQKLSFGALELIFVTSALEVIDPPLATAVMNDGCKDTISKTQLAGAENPLSVGFLARFGKFDFVDLGDLTWNAEQALVCPINRLGPVELYQVSHHGMDLSSSPQLVNSLAPLVAVMNNGASKGGAAATFETLRAAPGFKDLWSLHRVTANDDAHNADKDLTANLTGQDQAFGIEAAIAADGTFTLKNQRTGLSRTYDSR